MVESRNRRSVAPPKDFLSFSGLSDDKCSKQTKAPGKNHRQKLSKPPRKSHYSRESFGGLFGHFLNKEALSNLSKYKYTSCGSTYADRFMDHWWNLFASFVPMNVAPNVLTLIGFMSIILGAALTFFYMPTLEEAAPRWLYFFIAFLIFVYQTFDAVDGKHARRTGTSNPMGQIFDHGCDSFTTVLLAMVAAGVARLGFGSCTLALVSVLQAQLFLASWWDMQFHVFPHCSGQFIGVTEGQFVLMFVCLIGGIAGPETFLTPVAELINKMPITYKKLLPSVLHSSGTKLSTVLFVIVICLLGTMIAVDLTDGIRKVPNKSHTLPQLLSCFVHLFFQYLFYYSGVAQSHPVWTLTLMTVNSSIMALRMELAAVGKREYSIFQWPVYPMTICGILLYFGPLQSLHDSLGSEAIRFQLLLGLIVWSFVYLIDFVITAINDICGHLNISCLSIKSKLVKSKGSVKTIRTPRHITK